MRGFPRGSVVKNLPVNAGDAGLTLGWEDPLEKEMDPLQYSCLGNSMDRGAWWATVCSFPKNWTPLGVRLPSGALGWGGAGRGGGRPLLVPGGTADGSGDVIVCPGEFTSAFLTSIQRDAFGN